MWDPAKLIKLNPEKGMRAPWGKASEGRFHHLAHHCADVAACFEALCAQPVIRSRMERAAQRTLTPVDIARLGVLTFLHDAGKLHPGFQARAWTDGSKSLIKVGHLDAGAAIFGNCEEPKLGEFLHLEALNDWGINFHVLLSILAHHGRPFDPSGNACIAERHWKSSPDYNPVPHAETIGKAAERWFPDAFQSSEDHVPSTPPFQHLLCGLVTLADWLGSTETLFPYVDLFDPNYISAARVGAKQALARVGLDAEKLRAAVTGRSGFASLTGGFTPRPAQATVGETDLEAQLLILEAETGAGKTEAALWRFVQLLEAGAVDSLYFALPTRAAARQIHGRVCRAMANVFGTSAPEPILSIPGYLKAGQAEGQALPGWRVRWDDDDGREEQNLISRWAAESSRKFLASTVAVGTVDQAMLAGLQVRHAHLRAAALSRSLLVIDEVHASDRYMSEVQGHLLKNHRTLGGYAMLMSATLGSSARQKWFDRSKLQQPMTLGDAITQPYPAVWTSGSAKGSTAADEENRKRIVMTACDAWDAETTAVLAGDAAGKGARVLVIRNTVSAAQEVFQAIRESGAGDLLWQVAGHAALHHSRFAAEDRNLLDIEVERALPPTASARPEGGVIVIGTQTLEQSLDIDADFLITDLSPADVLLQRIGRLHRHSLARPAGFETPQCIVLCPERGLDHLTKPAFENGIGGFSGADRVIGGVYTNLHACELTRRLIAEHPEWIIPDMNRLLVESATHDEMIEALCVEKGDAWRHYWNTIYGQDLANVGAANNVALVTDTDFADAGLFPSDQEAVRTRLGAEGARIKFVDGTVGPFGQVISTITIPAHWSRGIDIPEDPVSVSRQGECWHFLVGSASFVYGKVGLMRTEQNVPTA